MYHCVPSSVPWPEATLERMREGVFVFGGCIGILLWDKFDVFIFIFKLLIEIKVLSYVFEYKRNIGVLQGL